MHSNFYEGQCKYDLWSVWISQFFSIEAKTHFNVGDGVGTPIPDDICQLPEANVKTDKDGIFYH